MNKRDLTGQRFGRLVALRDSGERRGGHVMWHCICDCGKLASVRSNHLVNGTAKSCGCLYLVGRRFGRLEVVEERIYGTYLKGREEHGPSTDSHPPKNKKDLTSQRFGRLVALRDNGERRHGQVVWDCICDCGKTVAVCSHSLIRGAAQSCGCRSVDATKSRRIDLVGQRFGRLEVIESMPSQQWLCRCDCGTQVVVSRGNLTGGKTRSCGCLRKEKIAAMEDARQAGYEAIKALRVDGTNTSLIREGAKIKRNNTTGVRGVSRHGNSGYRAYIGFKGRTTYLGLYPTIEEAAVARREAEERIYRAYLAGREKGIT